MKLIAETAAHSKLHNHMYLILNFRILGLWLKAVGFLSPCTLCAKTHVSLKREASK